MKDSHKVFISDETWRWIRGFLPVARKVMGAPDFSETDLVQLAIWEGFAKMLIDVVPEDSGVVLESFKRMTIENPEDVGKIIVGRMKKREARSLLKKWKENKFFSL